LGRKAWEKGPAEGRVQKIKGTKYSEEEIEAALDEFAYFGKHI
jgi:hypothetical protein